MTRWFMMAGLVGVASFVADEAFAQDNTGAKKKQAAKNKKGKKAANKNDGVGPFKKDDYPLAERMRPLILPNGMGEIGADLPITYASFAGDSTTAFGIGTQFNYGLGNKVELGLQPLLGFSLSPGDPAWSKTVGVRAAWLAWDSKDFDFAPAVTIPLVFEGDTGIGVNIDLLGRYVLSEGWFLTFGQGAINMLVAPDFGLGINVSGGAGYQFSPKAALLFGTTPLFITLVPAGGGDVAALGIWDVFNLYATIQYTPSRQWDVGLTVAPTYFVDAEALSMGFDIFARFRF